MNIINGQKYTFSFTPSGVDLSSPFSNQGDAVVQSLLNGGFPISNPTASQSGALAGYLGVSNINVTFFYLGANTDDTSLGNAMASYLTGDFSTSSFSFAGAQGGQVASPGSLTDLTQKATSALPSISVLVAAVALIAIAVYSFAGAAGHEAAARV